MARFVVQTLQDSGRGQYWDCAGNLLRERNDPPSVTICMTAVSDKDTECSTSLEDATTLYHRTIAGMGTPERAGVAYSRVTIRKLSALIPLPRETFAA